MKDLGTTFAHAIANGSKTLDLSTWDFTEIEALEALVRVVSGGEDSHSLTNLDLSAAKFTASHFSLFLKALKENSFFTEVNLSTNHLCVDYITADDGSFCALLKCNKRLRMLDLTGHAISNDVIVDITEGLKHNSTLEELVLHNCSLTEEQAMLVLDSARNLLVLDLGSNKNISPTFLNTCVADCLVNTPVDGREPYRLESLVLNNSASMFAVQDPSYLSPFLNALEVSSNLKSLSLRCCHLIEPVGEAILNALTVNNTLIMLDLEFSGFGLRDRGNEILITLIPRFRALRHLKMLVRYSPRLSPSLVEAVNKNRTLHTFRPLLAGGEHADEQRDMIRDALERNVRMYEAQSLMATHAHVPSSILPLALAHLAQTRAGAPAVFQTLQYWAAEFAKSGNSSQF